MAEDDIKGLSAAEKIAQHLEALIREGSLRPGEVLLSERDMALRLNVSRPTLRQGLRRLEDRGLIRAEAGGTRVVSDPARGLTDPLLALLESDSGVVDDYLEFRATAEAAAARLAAGRANEVDRARLTECMAAIDAAHEAGDHLAGSEADVRLHVAIYEASHNVVLLHLMRALSAILRRDVFQNREVLFTRPETREPLRAQHRAIYEAVMARDAEAAARAAEAHVDYTRRALAEIRAAEARLEISLRRIDGAQLVARNRRPEG